MLSVHLLLLKEYIDGQLVHTRITRERKLVEEHLMFLGRYKHLFEPGRNNDLIAEIHTRVDRYREKLGQ